MPDRERPRRGSRTVRPRLRRAASPVVGGGHDPLLHDRLPDAASRRPGTPGDRCSSTAARARSATRCCARPDHGSRDRQHGIGQETSTSSGVGALPPSIHRASGYSRRLRVAAGEGFPAAFDGVGPGSLGLSFRLLKRDGMLVTYGAVAAARTVRRRSPLTRIFGPLLFTASSASASGATRCRALGRRGRTRSTR